MVFILRASAWVPNCRDVFMLDCDASYFAIGVKLLQVQDRKECDRLLQLYRDSCPVEILHHQ